ncbi:uncharacterized protein LOC129218700 isoform X2 [Uloborus diversus]|uniref:uncharacterized protein LOC129218700 isoform X2 n=1 Tax=Uloborus diversus TaxID=327109 RepID=UPI002409F1E3|nr:uncharacterized protein LOC129218700 isoform X2 [Uloborus diversus]
MESENEGSPLLNSFQEQTWRSRFKRRCLRIPSEITITGIILGLFLIVVALLILLQNLQSSATTDLVIEDNLLGSSMKLEHNLGKTWQEKVKRKQDKANETWQEKVNKNKETRQDKVNNNKETWQEKVNDNKETWHEKVNNKKDKNKDKDKDKNKDKDLNKRTERQSTMSVQDSPMKYGLKTLGKSWPKEDDAKKTKEKEKHKDKNVDKRTERLSTASVLESPFKYNKKDLDAAWKDKKDFFIPTEHDRKWDKVDKGWKTFSADDNLLGSPMKFNEKDLDQSWKDKKDYYIHKDDDASWNDGKVAWEDTPVNLLGSPFKFNKKDLDMSWQEKKAQYRPGSNDQKWDNADKGWKKISYDFLNPSYQHTQTKEAKEEIRDASNKKWDNVNKGFKKVSDDHLLLGSPLNYDSNEFQNFWKDMTNFPENEQIIPGKKWNNVDKGWKQLSAAGWSGKDIKKALLDSWIDGQEVLKSYLTSDDINWDQVDDGWKKLSEQGWTDANIKEALIQAWKRGLGILKSRMKFDNKTWKRINDGWENFSNHSKSVAAPSMCPLALLNSENSLGAPIPQETIDCALIAEEVRKTLGRCIDLSFLPKECKPSWRVKCFTTYKYRKADGTCNNKMHPTWGQSGTPFVRMTEPDYSDGVSAIRKAKSGDELPNARLLSRKLYSEKLKPDLNITTMFLIFGLMVDHDIVQTGLDPSGIPCCDERFALYPQTRPRECLQIEVPEDDPFYGPRNVKCLNLVRSLPVHGECMGRREQLNQATSFLDGSTIYGSSIQVMKSLRSFNKGQLKMQMINNVPFMSFAEKSGYSCGTPSEPLKCFAAGDSRANMLVELTAILTIWYREHNRIASALHKLNPKWTDETLFQEARRILIAELQHIAYNEFLPSLLGDKALEEYMLKINPNETYKGYDDTIDPSVYNVFGAAAFRFGHSLAQDQLLLYGSRNKEDQVPLHETFFNPQILYHDGLDPLIRGAALQRTQSVDSYITPEVREHLFQPAGVDYGHDLAAVSIQRGRDHGLPGYTKWREVCGLPAVKEWNDLYEIMAEKRADSLKEVYESIDDIDLIPGALAENHVGGSHLGPTYLCIIGRQFKKTRKGDRFWFENRNQAGSFTEDQLKEIYKSSTARIICDNADNIQSVQKYPFEMPSESNPIMWCEEISALDLSKWN